MSPRSPPAGSGPRSHRRAKADREELALRLSSAVLETIAEHTQTAEPDHQLVEPIERLTAIEPVAPTGETLSLRQPLTPLRDTVLMTNAKDQPSVGSEIAAEIESADRIDLVLAFIRWTGIRDLLDVLRRHTEAGKPLRVITTIYTGSTEQRALEALQDLGAEVRVSYDTSTTRLHAKAWMFHRASGFSTVYIGSSNLTFSAQVAGLEWNVRGSQRRNPELVDAFDRTFASYWADDHFEPFDPEQFEKATQRESADAEVTLTPFQIEPYPFQRTILERLEVERRRGRPHNLVVAATGTGKTVVAALDYRRLRDTIGPVPPALRRPPPGDPQAVPHHVSPRAAQRLVRRAVGRWRTAGRVAARVRLDPVDLRQRSHVDRPGAVRRRHRRRVPPRRGQVLRGAARPPDATAPRRPHGDAGTYRRPRRPPLVRRPDRRGAPAVGCARARTAVAVPLLRDLGRDRSLERCPGRRGVATTSSS